MADRHGFQFHNGSIKGDELIWDMADRHGFQFHNGSIKGEFVVSVPYLNECFNSTMVRLKSEWCGTW